MLCNDDGFSFYWPNKKSPHLQDENGRKYFLAPSMNVPYIIPGASDSDTEFQDDSFADEYGNLPPLLPPDLVDSSTDDEAKKVKNAGGDPRPKEKKPIQKEAEKKPKRRKQIVKLRLAGDCKHNEFTHFPKDPNCKICQECKTQRAPCRVKKEKNPDSLPDPKEFGDVLTADHGFIGDENEDEEEDRTFCGIQDGATAWLQGYPAESKDSEKTEEAFRRFLGPNVKAKYVYTDNASEFEKSLKKMGILHDPSSPYRSETNGVAERAVRKIKEGTGCTRIQAGLSVKWWGLAMKCFCFLRNIVDALQDGKTPWERRFGAPFDGPIWPCGAYVKYKPYSPTDKARLEFGDKLLPGIFVGYEQRAGGGWSRNLLIIDWEQMDTADRKSQVHTRTVHYKEVFVQKDQ
jgi:hypothetical protein